MKPHHETQMSQAFTAAGYKPGVATETARERLEDLMIQAIAANNGLADPSIDAFIKALLAEDDAELVWTLVEEVRMPAIRKLFGIVHFHIQQQRAATQQSRTSSGGQSGQAKSDTPLGSTARSPEAQTSSGGRDGPTATDTHPGSATRSPETALDRDAVWKPNWGMPVAPSSTPPPSRPTQALPEAIRKTHSKLDMQFNGRALGDLDPEEAATVKNLRAIDARFIALLISRLPPGRRHRIRDFVKPEEADELYEIAKRGD